MKEGRRNGEMGQYVGDIVHSSAGASVTTVLPA